MFKLIKWNAIMCDFFNIILFFRNYFLKMPLPNILEELIIRTKDKLNQSNLKTYCKCCIDALGEVEGKKVCFPNKTDRILQHLKKCKHFQENATPEAQEEISLLLKSNKNQVESLQIKRSCNFFIFLFFIFLFFNTLHLTVSLHNKKGRE